MQLFLALPREIIQSFLRNRALIVSLTRREILGRYQGSIIGIMWSFINPLFMLLIYTFIFSVVFKAKWAAGSDSKTEFALVLFAGLIVFNLFAECISRSPSIITSNVNFVKKVIFPIEILPFVLLGTALFHGLVSVFIWLLAYTVLYGLPHATILLLPVILLPLLLFIIGVSWFLSALGVYLRDLNQFVGVLVTVLMFLSPIFYPVSALPEKYQIFLMFNPISPVIEQFRDILYWGILPNWTIYLRGLCISLVCAILGFSWFKNTRAGFADVL